MIPFMREKFSLEYEDIDHKNERVKYRRQGIENVKEKRIFGIFTKFQVGHIPNLQISSTEDEQNFCRETYVFKSMPSSGKIIIDLEKE